MGWSTLNVTDPSFVFHGPYFSFILGIAIPFSRFSLPMSLQVLLCRPLYNFTTSIYTRHVSSSFSFRTHYSSLHLLYFTGLGWDVYFLRCVLYFLYTRPNWSVTCGAKRGEGGRGHWLEVSV